jgi:perosamine synthetase
MSKIQLFKSHIDKKDFQVMKKSIESGWLTHGENNLIFEKNFNQYTNSKYSISMNSCTSALECALKMLKKKGEVIIPSWTWVSTANAVLNTGNIPVFADVDINSRNITVDEIKKSYNKNIVAVIVVHYSGLPCDMDEIVKFTNSKKILLIEDSAETLGATYKNKYTGTFGIGCFSFFPTKNITTTEGGMLTTKNKKYYNIIKKLIAHGIDKNKKPVFWHRESVLPGHNFRLPNHLAALGINQLKKIEIFNKKRRIIAKKYDEFLSKYSNLFIVQTVDKNYTHSYQMYTSIIKNNLRDKFLNHMNKNGIPVSAHFVPPLHKQKYLKKYSTRVLKNTDFLSKNIVTLPLYPNLKNQEFKKILNTLKKWVKVNA